MKKIYFFLLMMMLGSAGWGQVSLTNGSPSYAQNFDGMAATLNLPTNWRMAASTASPTWAAASTTVTQQASSGTPTAGGTYNFGSTAAERAIGAMTSGGFASPNNPLSFYVNGGTTNITDLLISYDAERYRVNTVAASIQFFYSLNGTSWTAVPAGDVAAASFPTGASSYTFATPLTINVTGISITGLSIAPGSNFYLRWNINTGGANSQGITIDNLSLTATFAASSTPDIALSSPNPAIAAGNVQQGSTNNPIYRFDLAVTTASATLNGVTVTTAGTYAASDLVNLKCWYSADNTFNAGTDVLLSTKTTALGAGAQVFPSFTNQNIGVGTTGFIFITADIACNAAFNNISVNAITTADISFVSGNKSGAAFAGDAQTIVAGTVNNATGLGASTANSQSSVSWTNPTGCYDEIMIVAAANSTNTGTPTGDGTAYTANLAFGSGTALGNGFVAYKGSTSPQVITNLVNGTTYFFKIFTRLGTTWSSGVEVSATPAAVSSATDFFRSAGTGAWNTNASWESSPDGSTNWVPATLQPTSASGGITIRNTHTITITASGLTIDQVTIETTGQLTINSGITFTLGNGTGVDLDCFGTFLNSGGAHTWTGTMTIESGGTYIHNTTSSSTAAYTAATINTNSIWIYRGSSTLNPSSTFSNRTYGHLRLESTSGALTFTPSIGAGISCTVNDLFIGSNVTLNCGSLNTTSVFNIGGSLTNNGNIDNSVGFFNATFTGASKTIGGSNVPNFDALIISNTATTALATNIALPFLASSLTIQPTGSLNAGTFQVTGPGSAAINGKLISANANGIGSTGTLANTGTKTLGAASTIEFSSASAQVLNNRSDYANLIISGGGTKTTDGNVTMSGVLTLTSGTVVLNANNLVMTSNATGAIAAYSPTSYIVTNGTGFLQRAVSGAGTYAFPVGLTGYLQEASVNFAAPLGAPNTLAARFIFGHGGSNGLPLSESGDNISRTSVIGFWEINAGTPFADAYTGTFIARSFGDITDYSKLHLLKRANAASPWTLDGTHVPTTGSNALATLQRTGMSGFSQFGVGGENNVSLPVIFVNFSGYKDGSRNQLRWTTATETDNLGYEVQRSTDGVSYSVIGFVNSLAVNGNSSDELNYVFTDNAPVGTRQYYRLRQVDRSNQTKLSTVVLIRGNKPTSLLIDGLFPNPAKSLISVLIAAPARSKATLVISDMAGRIVQQKEVNVATGSNTVQLDISDLQRGAYVVRMSCADGCETMAVKFVKQ